MALAANGDLWIAAGDQVCRFRSATSGAGWDECVAIPEAGGVGALAGDGSDGVWCGAAHGLLHVSNGKAHLVDIGASRQTGLDEMVETPANS